MLIILHLAIFDWLKRVLKRFAKIKFLVSKMIFNFNKFILKIRFLQNASKPVPIDWKLFTVTCLDTFHLFWSFFVDFRLKNRLFGILTWSVRRATVAWFDRVGNGITKFQNVCQMINKNKKWKIKTCKACGLIKTALETARRYKNVVRPTL